MKEPNFYYFFCNHWTQGGIGFAFPSGWLNGKKYERTFSTSYTIHKLLDAADQYPGLKVSMELDAYAYAEVKKEDQDCIERLKRYIKDGKAAVEGGTFGQPFGQDYGWEPNIRHLTQGRKVIKDILDYDIKTFLVEEQWFHPQMPQLLEKSGFKYASLQNQNSGQVMPMNEAMIKWLGIDGTAVYAIPANDLMISCVRQYTGYKEYKDRLLDYERPLLFQWIEIWPPGYDWGASATPFEKAIQDVQASGGKCVSLQEYFEVESKNRKLKEIYIPLDNSNYANNWYQGGGWGYDGDKVIQWDQKAEQALLSYETLSTLHDLKKSHPYNQEKLQMLWNELLILQNHDFSVARSYRAITSDGLVTNAGSYGIVKYEQLMKECQNELTNFIQADKEKLIVSNYTGVAARKTVPFEIDYTCSENVSFKQKNEDIPFYIEENDGEKIKGVMVVNVPPVGTATVAIEKKPTSFIHNNEVQIGEDWIEDKHYKITWEKRSWKINIYSKEMNQTVSFIGFTGPIGKQNEHDGNIFPALSPAHEIFTFAFDGTTHCPDQLSLSRIKASIESQTAVTSTLLLHCDLLTLHTTDTPVAFAEARVVINHVTGEITCNSYLYTGVNLSVNCEAIFEHNFSGATYHRDFPFGEEEAHVDSIYANTYVRVSNKSQGFTLVHPGVQRVTLQRQQENGKVKHLLARDKIFGEYDWTFSLAFGCHTPWESAKFSKMARSNLPVYAGKEQEESILQFEDDRLLMSALYKEEDHYYLRFINYSNEEIEKATIKLCHPFKKIVTVDFEHNELSHVPVENNLEVSLVHLPLKPWQIVTLKLLV